MAATSSSSTDSDKSDTNSPKEVPKKFQIEKYEHPGVPPIYTPDLPYYHPKFTPLLVFGFAITVRDKDDFVRRLSSTLPSEWNYLRKHGAAFDTLLKQIPRKYMRYFLQPIEFDELAHCVVLATNTTKEEIHRCLDMTMIEEVHEILQTYYPPGWFIATDD